MIIKIGLILLISFYSSHGISCSISNLHSFMKMNLDDPTIKLEELESQKYPENITIVKYKTGCGFLGCTYNIFKKVSNCYSHLGTYHGKLTKLKGSKNGHPTFGLSFPSGDKVKLYFDPKKNKYLDK